MRYYLFTTRKCREAGACLLWGPVLRQRYGDALIEVVDSITTYATRTEFLTEAFLFMAAHGPRIEGPVVVELDGDQRSGRRARRMGVPCGRCDGLGCGACDGGVAWTRRADDE